jgi:large subunit ribosomal protein L21e
MFSQPFRYGGAIRMKNYLTVFKVGDFVDVKVDASQHKGMPFKFYHGRTGKVFNVNKRALGVIVNK